MLSENEGESAPAFKEKQNVSFLLPLAVYPTSIQHFRSQIAKQAAN